MSEEIENKRRCIMRPEFIRTRIMVPILSVAAVTIFPACEGNGITKLEKSHEAIPRPTFTLVVEPSEPILEAGETIQLKAYLRNSQTGFLHPVEGPIQWTSEDPLRAMVSETGLVEAYARGEVIIMATQKGGNPDLPENQAQARVLVT
jgi:hypothetical protein